MIISFKSSDTQLIFNGKFSKRFPVEIQPAAFRKLGYIHAADDITDLKLPPGNRLEMLKGNRGGQYSIQINNQWRICFRWNQGAHDVEITDYH